MIAALAAIPAAAMTLKEFLKFTPVEQGTYIGAAVSMLTHTYAANGNPTKARCIQRWYFGDRRERAEPPGAREVSISIWVDSGLQPADDRACPTRGECITREGLVEHRTTKSHWQVAACAVFERE